MWPKGAKMKNQAHFVSAPGVVRMLVCYVSDMLEVITLVLNFYYNFPWQSEYHQV